MIFLTVGTILPFDRLVRAVDEAVGHGLIQEEVFAQIGKTKTIPKHIESADVLDKDTFGAKVRQASSIISHAGMGSITMALTHNKPLLVMPRLKRFGEHVNDHQLGTARKFEELGCVVVAYTEEELPGKVRQLKTFVPKKRTAAPEAVAQRIAGFLDELAKESKRR
jgi:UDP-N-acetylglucosamine transferase subunit ALG13